MTERDKLKIGVGIFKCQDLNILAYLAMFGSILTPALFPYLYVGVTNN
jgi:hypothetical protein